MGNRAQKEFAVIKRIVGNDDEIEAHVLVVITGAGQEVTEGDVKEIVEKVGFYESYGEESVDFSKGWKVVLVDALQGETKGWKADVLHYVKQIKAGREAFLPYEFSPVVLTYDELLDKLDDEKRFTLRLPVGLHTALVKAAKETSLNRFCVNTLAGAISYKMSERETR